MKTTKFIIFLFISVLLFACSKTISFKEAETELIKKYLDTLKNGNEFIETKSGIYYFVKNKQIGHKITKDEQVTINYSGFYIENKEVIYFVKDEIFKFKVGDQDIINGLNEVMLLLNDGDHVHAIIPFKLAYGNEKTENIPEYSTLFIDFYIVSQDININTITEYDTFLYNNKDITLSNNKFAMYYIFQGIGEKKQLGQTLNIEYKLTTLNDSLIEIVDNYQLTIDTTSSPSALHHALLNIKDGSMAKVFMAQNLAFGKEGTDKIPPYSNLCYQIRLLSSDLKIKEHSDLQKYLLNNNITQDTTISGMYFISIQEGEGELITTTDSVIINIRGTDLWETEFFRCDSCKYLVTSEQLVSGVQEALLKMKLNSKSKIILPSKLGYAESPWATLPAYSNLIYYLEIRNISK